MRAAFKPHWPCKTGWIQFLQKCKAHVSYIYSIQKMDDTDFRVQHETALKCIFSAGLDKIQEPLSCLSAPALRTSTILRISSKPGWICKAFWKLDTAGRYCWSFVWQKPYIPFKYNSRILLTSVHLSCCLHVLLLSTLLKCEMSLLQSASRTLIMSWHPFRLIVNYGCTNQDWLPDQPWPQNDMHWALEWFRSHECSL